MIKAKYGVDDWGWRSKKSSYAYEVGCWKPILAGMSDFKS